MKKGNAKKVVLAYSGGLDTSVAIKWLQEKGYEVITFTADVGQSVVDLEKTKRKALETGASKAYVMNLQEDFVSNFVWPVLKANALYQGTYPLHSAISRPLIAQYLSLIAQKEEAPFIAHGCTGKGQDQVRIEVCANAINPNLEVLAPVRDWQFSREEEIAFAQKHGIPVANYLTKIYSIDENIWGRAIECGVLENPWIEPPEDAFAITQAPWNTPESPLYLEIAFSQGVPFALDGKTFSGVEIIKELNTIGGNYGVGRIDMIEDRLVGFKSREVYECPGATILIEAHKALETLTLTKDVLQGKSELEKKYAQLSYEGLWFAPMKEALDSFFNHIQQTVTGTVKVRLYKGQITIAGIKSSCSLYQENLATYTSTDIFDHKAAPGFIKIWGTSVKTWRQTHPFLYNEEKQNRTDSLFQDEHEKKKMPI